MAHTETLDECQLREQLKDVLNFIIFSLDDSEFAADMTAHMKAVLKNRLQNLKHELSHMDPVYLEVANSRVSGLLEILDLEYPDSSESRAQSNTLH